MSSEGAARTPPPARFWCVRPSSLPSCTTLTSQFAFWNDLFFGGITIGLGGALGGAAIEYGGEEEAPAG
jgi:hypothetical protein